MTRPNMGLSSLRHLVASLLGVATGIFGTCFGQSTLEGALTVPDAKPSSTLSDATIRGTIDGSPISLTVTKRLAGAVHSLQWRDKEFIDSADHGRQLQSASSFDAMQDGPFWAECYNPTEAGSRLDGDGERSTSHWLGLQVFDREIRTSTQMAFWLAPGELSSGRPALNRSALSDHYLHKSIRLNAHTNEHVIEYNNTFELPSTESHRFAQFEIVTGYMPAEFHSFWAYLPNEKRLKALEDGPGEQAYPIVFSTENGQHAMGAMLDGWPGEIDAKPGYGRFRFEQERVVKWNVVMRYRALPSIRSGNYSFRVLILVGALHQVLETMNELHALSIENRLQHDKASR